MNINTFPKSAPRPRPQSQSQNQSVSLSEGSGLKDKFESASALLVPASGVAGAGTAAYYASDLLHFGDGMPALYGGLAGGVIGTGIGLGAGFVGSKLYDKYSNDDPAGKGLMSGFMVMGGAACGAIAGTVSGAFGANPLVTVPAALVGGVAGVAATASLHTALFGE